MSVLQRFDSLINSIEDSVMEKPYKDARTILGSSAKQIEFYGSERDLNAIFQFFTGEGLIRNVHMEVNRYFGARKPTFPAFHILHVSA